MEKKQLLENISKLHNHLTHLLQIYYFIKSTPKIRRIIHNNELCLCHDNLLFSYKHCITKCPLGLYLYRKEIDTHTFQKPHKCIIIDESNPKAPCRHCKSNKLSICYKCNWFLNCINRQIGYTRTAIKYYTKILLKEDDTNDK